MKRMPHRSILPTGPSLYRTTRLILFGLITGVFVAASSQHVQADPDVFGAVVCEGAAFPEVGCPEAGRPLDGQFQVEGWDNPTRLTAQSGNALVPRADRIEVRKTGFYTLSFGVFFFFNLESGALGPDSADPEANGTLFQFVNGVLFGACIEGPAGASSKPVASLPPGVSLAMCEQNVTIKLTKGDIITYVFSPSFDFGSSAVQVFIDIVGIDDDDDDD